MGVGASQLDTCPAQLENPALPPSGPTQTKDSHAKVQRATPTGRQELYDNGGTWDSRHGSPPSARPHPTPMFSKQEKGREEKGGYGTRMISSFYLPTLIFFARPCLTAISAFWVGTAVGHVATGGPLKAEWSELFTYYNLAFLALL